MATGRNKARSLPRLVGFRGPLLLLLGLLSAIDSSGGHNKIAGRFGLGFGFGAWLAERGGATRRLRAPSGSGSNPGCGSERRG